MKTSLAKTFQSVQNNKVDDVCDAIFGDAGSVSIQIDGREITNNDVFVIKSFESSYESDITALLVKDTVKEQLSDVLKARDKLLKALEKASGLRIKKTTGGRTIYELETTIVDDFKFDEVSILLNLDALQNAKSTLYCGGISYTTIFDPTVLKKIQSADFQEQIHAFTASCNQVYESFEYLEKGQLTFPKLKDIRKSLEKNCFFVRNNRLMLAGADSIGNLNDLEGKITDIENAIRQVPALQAIESLLGDSKGMHLKDIIETHPEIVEFLALEKLQMLRQSLWISYLHDNQNLFDDVCQKYRAFSDEIDEVAIDDTQWKDALEKFKERFTVPYTMEITNLKEAIIGESIPKVEFSFNREGQTVCINRAKLDELDTLSQGEKRALYLLNIIFDIENIKASGQEKLLIVDDIADSFDYKNKYAIIEYLYELSMDEQFYLLILSHNFDFYRTISSRLNLKQPNKLMANQINSTIVIEEDNCQNKPFLVWKKHPITKNILALIPFVRNLIEFGEDRNISKTGNDFLFLTSLLHEKDISHSITFDQILPLYNAYIGLSSFQEEVNPTDFVLDSLYTVCDMLTIEDTLLENKIVLAMAIRHKAEEYMFQQIHQYKGQLSWRKKRKKHSGTSEDFWVSISDKPNQTRELLNGYKQFGSEDSLTILNEVCIMTPENIHLNSFMYEPILDMDIVELLNLYIRIKGLL